MPTWASELLYSSENVRVCVITWDFLKILCWLIEQRQQLWHPLASLRLVVPFLRSAASSSTLAHSSDPASVSHLSSNDSFCRETHASYRFCRMRCLSSLVCTRVVWIGVYVPLWQFLCGRRCNALLPLLPDCANYNYHRRRPAMGVHVFTHLFIL